ncbi:hypothetical protein [Capillimicrobium parvum]|uniref:Uncharacterized protein n=1 Tax=Capillimicrobium parvum TaxID=2884022 RepID=A0A9E7C3A2_9ACTN|nr:hypothetical protein [Capillimicrobium parvum]UGS38427.1 hypothetical protein DSM104329_04855 [Capillimicrobium parvum]
MSDTDTLVALRDVCLPWDRPLHHVRALMRAGRLPEPVRVLDDGTELVSADLLSGLIATDAQDGDGDADGDAWQAHIERGLARFRDGQRRLPEATTAERRQQQLLRMGGAAWAASLGMLMIGCAERADEWLDRSATCYRWSLADAEAGSWGRSIAAVKARLIAHDWPRARLEARWTLDLGAAEAGSPIARYAAALACLTLEDNTAAGRLAASVSEEDAFPVGIGGTSAALYALAACDGAAYGEAVGAVLRSFEERTRFLERVPVADTVIVLQRLAARRGMEAPLVSTRLPRSKERALSVP